MSRFDRMAPGEGMIIYSRVENGKAYLEFQFFLKTGEQEELQATAYFANIRIHDRDGRLALEMTYPMQEEEPAKGMLLHPRLWRGLSDPYLYSVTVLLLEEKDAETPLDMLERQLPLRSLEEIPKKGWFLNGELFWPHVVSYELGAAPECMKEDLLLLRQMGANTLCLNWAEYHEDFNVLCDELGLLVWYGEVHRGIPGVRELLGTGGEACDLYYYYKGRWSSDAFVYLVSKSLKRQKNGNFSLMVYSNQKRVALYAEGVLFEFQAGPPEFVFEEIPCGKYPLQLTAEAGECRASFTAYCS